MITASNSLPLALCNVLRLTRPVPSTRPAKMWRANTSVCVGRPPGGVRRRGVADRFKSRTYIHLKLLFEAAA
jgi:hypothetical protein